VLYLSQCTVLKYLSVNPLGLLCAKLHRYLLLFYALCVFYVAFCLRLLTFIYVPFVLFVLRY